MSFSLNLTRVFCSSGRSSLFHKISSTSPNHLYLPYRTTWILKRRVEPPEQPKHLETERLYLEDLYHEYLVIEQIDQKPREPIKVVLTEFVEDVGKRGQIVEVDPIDGYMYYILPGKAVYATPENIKKQQILSAADLEKHSSVSAYKTMKMLTKRTLSVFMNMHEPWTIQPWHIRVMLRLNGVHVLDENSIKLPEKSINGPDLKLEGKDFAITIEINNCEKANVRCRLRHWTKNYSEKILLPPDHECVQSDPIFPEQKEILDKIPLPVYVEEKKMV